MDGRVRKFLILGSLYVLALWIGFRAGEIYVRSTTKIQVQKILVPEVNAIEVYYVVEEVDYGTRKDWAFYTLDSNHAMIKCLFNEKLKPLLKLKKMQIYNAKGDRVY